MMNRPDLDNAMYGAVRETAIIPRQTVNLAPAMTVAGVQIRQLQVTDQAPVVPQSPINTQRAAGGAGTFRFAVQFIRDPSYPNYSITSVSLRAADGTLSSLSSSRDGPIIFSTPKTSAPAGVALGVVTNAGTESALDFGTGLSNGINRL